MILWLLLISPFIALPQANDETFAYQQLGVHVVRVDLSILFNLKKKWEKKFILKSIGTDTDYKKINLFGANLINFAFESTSVSLLFAHEFRQQHIFHSQNRNG